MEKDHEIVDARVTESSVAMLADDAIINIAEQVEKRVSAIQKIKLYALKLTNVYDWIDQGGRPYLYGSGAEKVARMFGISWRINEPEKENLGEGYYMFTYKGFFSLGGAEVEAIGTRSSKDPFFKKYKWVGKERVELPASEIDPGDVKKSALTNCVSNGVGKLLGIRNLTYEELESATGITKDMITKFTYKDKSGSPSIKSEGSSEVSGVVEKVEFKKGTNKSGKAYTMYMIHIAGESYKTFSESFAKNAQKAREQGKTVNVSFTKSQYGNDLESLTVIEKEAEGEATERLPGEEG